MRDERNRGRCCMAQRGNEGEKEEGDLKRATCWLRTHAIDRTYVRSIAFVLSVCVCEVGLCIRTNASEFECMPVSAIERTLYGRSHSAIFFFLTKNIYTHKSIPPPNIKCHIAHNVTGFTKPREWVKSDVA